MYFNNEEQAREILTSLSPNNVPFPDSWAIWGKMIKQRVEWIKPLLKQSTLPVLKDLEVDKGSYQGTLENFMKRGTVLKHARELNTIEGLKLPGIFSKRTFLLKSIDPSESKKVKSYRFEHEEWGLTKKINWLKISLVWEMDTTKFYEPVQLISVTTKLVGLPYLLPKFYEEIWLELGNFAKKSIINRNRQKKEAETIDSLLMSQDIALCSSKKTDDFFTDEIIKQRSDKHI